MKHQTWFLFALLFVSNSVFAQAPSDTAKKLSPAEQKFADLLTKAAMVGTFTVDNKSASQPKPERYTIDAVYKLNEETWVVQARITYNDVDVPVPVPVQVKWAGDTPVIQVTNLVIPGLGSQFTARVMFYETRYAGTWSHGQVGGHMWGQVERSEEEKKSPDQ